MHREPTTDWPNDPLTESQARNLLEGEVVAVWIMDYEENTRELGLESEIKDDGILDVVLESDDRYEMYSYTDYEGETMWVSFGTEWKDTDGGEMMVDTLESYRLLATQGVE